VRIASPLNHHQLENGQIGAVRFHESDVCKTGGGLDNNGLEFWLVSGCVELLLKVLFADAKAVHNLRQIFLDGFEIVAQEKDAKRRITIDEHTSFAIKHGSAGSDDGN